MKQFIPQKTYYLKMVEIFLIIVIIGLGLLAYKYFNISFFNNDNSFNFTSNFKYEARFIEKSFGRKIIVKENNELAKSIPVLLYHGVMDKIDNSDKINISYDNFANQMISLKENGWQTVKLEDFILFNQGKKELPAKSFLLTFDDGRRDTYYPIDPILKKLNFSAVIFVITKYSMEDKKTNFYLSKEELKKMNESGRWEIQSHTREAHNMYKIDQSGKLGNFYSNKLWLEKENRLEANEEFTERIKKDLISAKNDVEQGLGVKVMSFAYPFGDYGQQSINFPESESIILEIVSSIYPVSFYQVQQDSGFSFNYQGQNQNFIKRIEVAESWNSNKLLKILDIAKEKTIPFEDNFKEHNGWLKTWGKLSLKDNSMILEASSNSTGSSVFLDGTNTWINYAFQTNINWRKGSNVVLLARYSDDNNYLACNFSSERLRFEEEIDGKQSIQEKLIDFDFPKENLKLGIKVNGTNVKCMLDGKIIANYSIENNRLMKGGIGFKTWDQKAGNSEVEVNRVNVANEWNEDYPVYQNIEKEKQAEKKEIEIKVLPYFLSVFSKEQDWISNWGANEFINDKMIIKANEKTTGSLVFLQGSEDWRNYLLTTKIDWAKGSNFVILSRLKDVNNYLAFNVGKDYIRLEKYENGKSKIIKEVVNDLNFKKDNIQIKINVEGNHISCFINGKLVLEDSNNINDFLSGGFGFKVWDKKLNNSQINIEEVRVETL